MIRTIKLLFCDNEHGTGDVTFPDLRDIDERTFIDGPLTVKALRGEARKAGWAHTRDGRDWCPGCAEDCAPTTRRKTKPQSGNLFEQEDQ